MPTVIDLATLGSEGFSVLGGGAGSNAGRSVSGAGDVNGDGFDDVIILSNLGTAYVVYGRPSGFSELDLSDLQPSEGFQITTGWQDLLADVAGVGDVNGDGFDDLIVGGSNYYGWYGPFDRAWVIFGSDDERDAVNVSGLSSSDGVVIFGGYSGNLDGMSVAAAGDVNGDGIDDMIVGAPSGAGAAYVIFGKATWTANINISSNSIDPANGFKVAGQGGSQDRAGLSVAAAGDINGDGYDDIIVGAPYGDDGGVDAGEAYVIFGKASGFGPINPANLTGSVGFIIQGDAAGDYAGFSVSGAGDVNGDGFDDILVGAPDADNNHELAGEAYVIFGKANGFGTIDLSNLAAGAGFAIYGDDTADHAGFSVSAAGDVNNDGYDDIIIGAPENDNNRDGVRTIDAGEAYVIFGKAGGFGTIDLSDLSTAAGFIIQGAAAGDQAGFSVSGAGDVDGDGYDDLVIGSPFNDRGGVNAGATYVLSGKLSFVADGKADFNGDGRSDILWLHDNGAVFEWLGQANGSFAFNQAATYQLPSNWAVAAIGDFNGDGRDDAMWRSSTTGGTMQWLGQANGSFAYNAAGSPALATEWKIVGAGDFNGDGRDDLMLRSSTGGLTNWQGQQNGSFVASTAMYQLGTSWQVAAIGDFNGDSRDDLLLRHSNGDIIEWLGQANGSFAFNPGVTYALPTNWAFAGTGDFDNDNRADVLWRSSQGTLIEWLGQSSGAFAFNAAATLSRGTDWHVVGIGDVNGDNRDDLLWRNDNGTFNPWIGHSDGSFTQSNITYSLPAEWSAQPENLWA